MVVLVAVIAVCLIAIIVFIKLGRSTESALEDVDEQLVITAEHEARLEYMQNDLITQVVYDAENKTFVDPTMAKSTVEPYGSSKKNRGKYLLITIGNDETVSSKWVTP
ncbi:hypothetical protein SAMN04487770_10479 [Butyrivibrio sp. ob235]|nr:hypothetical protein SAMN04487770_10479 [Butyrivibrio sp. ob235]